jgi:hypothetical protein
MAKKDACIRKKDACMKKKTPTIARAVDMGKDQKKTLMLATRVSSLQLPASCTLGQIFF